MGYQLVGKERKRNEEEELERGEGNKTHDVVQMRHKLIAGNPAPSFVDFSYDGFEAGANLGFVPGRVGVGHCGWLKPYMKARKGDLALAFGAGESAGDGTAGGGVWILGRRREKGGVRRDWVTRSE